MSCNISFRDITFSPTSAGVRVRAWTDVPAHLFLRLSSQEPRVHRKPSLRRGVQFAEDVRFCFTVFEDNEQEEAGDTLVHTWNKPAWPFCTTKHLYLFGSVAGEICPSTTAPISYHNDYVAPVPETFFTTGWEEMAWAPDTPLSWAAARGQVDGRWQSHSSFPPWNVQRPWSNRNYIGGYMNCRNWITFDTRELAASWPGLYSTVTMRLYVPAGRDWWTGGAPHWPLEDGHNQSNGDIFITENVNPWRLAPLTPPG